MQANVRGRDIVGVMVDTQAAINTNVRLRVGTWLAWGGQFENLERARGLLALVVPLYFVLIVCLLYSSLKSWRYGHRVHRRAAGPGWRDRRPVAARDAVLDLGGGRLHRAVGRGGAQRLGDGGRHRWLGASPAVGTGGARRHLGRLRLVLMTAPVASLGFVPMALATGGRAEVQRPLATVVIGGLVSGILLTLFVMPSLYLGFVRPKAEAARYARET